MNPVLYLLYSLDFLDWWLLAGLLALADVLVPRARLLALAWAAGLVGFVLMLFPQLPWPWQLGGFVLLAVESLLGYLEYAHRQARALIRSQP